MNVPVNVELNLKHMFYFLQFKKKILLGAAFIFDISYTFEQTWCSSTLRALENDGHITSNYNTLRLVFVWRLNSVICNEYRRPDLAKFTSVLQSFLTPPPTWFRVKVVFFFLQSYEDCSGYVRLFWIWPSLLSGCWHLFVRDYGMFFIVVEKFWVAVGKQKAFLKWYISEKICIVRTYCVVYRDLSLCIPCRQKALQLEFFIDFRWKCEIELCTKSFEYENE